jgi:2-oxoglutarate dehydrogenase E2 component (dihydrolipoamide succinyltransferase)
VDMSAVMALRETHKAAFEKRHGVRLGFMSFFVKAAVDALRAVPLVNAWIDGEELVQNHFYDVGMAVSSDRGLVVPVIRDCDRLSYADIERRIAELAERVRQRTVTLEDLTGGCFTITNGGVFGSLLSTPILNPPQSGILGLHGIKQRPVVVGESIVARPMMYLALSYDHRVVDGQAAVTFLRRIVDCVERPERLLLEV